SENRLNLGEAGENPALSRSGNGVNNRSPNARTDLCSRHLRGKRGLSVDNPPIPVDSRHPAGVFVTSPIAIHLRVPFGRLALLALALFGVFILALLLGSVNIPLDDIFTVLG